MQTIDVAKKILCPICGHSVRWYHDDMGRIAWCGWCGTVALFEKSHAVPDRERLEATLLENAKQNLLARALCDQARSLCAESARLIEAISVIKEPRTRCCPSGGNDVDAGVSARIRRRRIMIGLSLQQMAARTGISCQQLRRYEYGTSLIYTDHLHKLAKALGISVNDLFGEQG